MPYWKYIKRNLVGRNVVGMPYQKYKKENQ